MTPDSEQQISYKDVWQYSAFRQFLIGQSLSMAGDAICLAALPVALMRANFDIGIFGVVMASVGAGSVIGALVGGFLADTQPPGKTLVLTDISRGILQFVAAISILINAPWVVLAFTYLLFGMAIGVSRPCAQVLLVSILPRHTLSVGNSVFNFVDNAVAILLPATFGIFLIVQAPLLGVLVDGLTFFAAAYFTSLIPSVKRVVAKVELSLREALRGMVVIRRHSKLAMGMSATLVINVLAFPVFLVAVPFIVIERFDESLWGLCLAASGVGACIGSVVAVLYKGHERIKLLAVMSTFVLGFTFSLFAFSWDAWAALVASVLVGWVEASWLTTWATVMQTSTPEKDLGKVIAVDTLLTTAMHPFVYLGCGVLGEAIGYACGLLVMGVIVVGAGVVLVVISIISTLRGKIYDPV